MAPWAIARRKLRKEPPEREPREPREPHVAPTRRTRLAHRRRLRGVRHAAGGQFRGAGARLRSDSSAAQQLEPPRRRKRQSVHGNGSSPNSRSPGVYRHASTFMGRNARRSGHRTRAAPSMRRIARFSGRCRPTWRTSGLGPAARRTAASVPPRGTPPPRRHAAHRRLGVPPARRRTCGAGGMRDPAPRPRREAPPLQPVPRTAGCTQRVEEPAASSWHAPRCRWTSVRHSNPNRLEDENANLSTQTWSNPDSLHAEVCASRNARKPPLRGPDALARSQTPECGTSVRTLHPFPSTL